MRRFWSYVIMTSIFVLILLMRECQHQRDTDNLLIDISNYKDTAYFYEAENGKVVAYNEALVLQNETQAKAILDKDEDFRILLEGIKNLDAAGSVTTIFQVKHDTLRLTDTIPCDFDPIAVERLSPEYNFHGTITRTDFIIDSLQIPNVMKFVVGEQKTGLFKRERRIEVINSNPLIQTTGVTAYTIEDKPKWGRTIVIAIGGAIVGILTERLLVKH